MLRQLANSLRYKKDNVPVLKVVEISEIAKTIIRDYDNSLLTNPGPLNVDDFVEFYLGYDIEEVYLSNDLCYYGRCVFYDEEVIPIYLPDEGKHDYIWDRSETILIDAQLSENPTKENLRRFTLMHEAGHAILHPRYYQNNGDQLILFETEEFEEENRSKASSTAEIISDYTIGKNES